MPYATIQLDFEGETARLTLNRPEKRNAISPEMVAELMSALDDVERSPARVTVLTGAGTAFCGGMDLAVLQSLAVAAVPKGEQDAAAGQAAPENVAAHLEDSRRIAALFRRIFTFPKPLIAAVNGAAIAGGCGIATLCDFTLAVPKAQFGYTEVRIGFIPALVSVFLIRQIGEKRARDLLLTGRLISAEEARAIGLVNEIVEPVRLLTRATELARNLLSASPTSLTLTKRLLVRFSEAELDRELKMAIEENAWIRTTADFREGLSAFLDKRSPVWHGS